MALLGFFHQHVEFGAAPDVEPPESVEELPEIFHG